MTTSLNATCPGCKSSFPVDPDKDGMVITCPQCQEMFLFEQAEEQPQPEQTPAATAETAHDSDEAYGITEENLGPRCPHCAAELPGEHVAVCLECGYNLQTRTLGRTRKTYEVTLGEKIAHIMPGVMGIIFIFLLAVAAFWFCLVFPKTLDDNSGLRWLDAESIRLYVVVLILGIMWSLGVLVYMRLIWQPVPEEEEKNR